MDRKRPYDTLVTTPAMSGIGAVIASQNGSTLFALCGECNLGLGWTWTNDSKRGYWSCLSGCRKHFNNKLGPETSSIRYSDDGRNLQEWVAGWLDVDTTDVEVSIA